MTTHTLAAVLLEQAEIQHRTVEILDRLERRMVRRMAAAFLVGVAVGAGVTLAVVAAVL